MMLSPVAGNHPRPGRHFRVRAGLALVLKTSMWAKRRYVHFKRWQPKAGRWADWGCAARARGGARCDRARSVNLIPGPPSSPPEMPGDPEMADRAD
jgi:hypothetical protein